MMVQTVGRFRQKVYLVDVDRRGTHLERHSVRKEQRLDGGYIAVTALGDAVTHGVSLYFFAELFIISGVQFSRCVARIESELKHVTVLRSLHQHVVCEISPRCGHRCLHVRELQLPLVKQYLRLTDGINEIHSQHGINAADNTIQRIGQTDIGNHVTNGDLSHLQAVDVGP